MRFDRTITTLLLGFATFVTAGITPRDAAAAGPFSRGPFLQSLGQTGVTVKVEGNTVSVKGPKGELSRTIPSNISVKLEGSVITLTRPSDETKDKSMHGLSRTLVANMVEGSVSAMCPASALQFHVKTTVICDRAAASRLRMRDYYQFVLAQQDALTARFGLR